MFEMNKMSSKPQNSKIDGTDYEYTHDQQQNGNHKTKHSLKTIIICSIRFSLDGAVETPIQSVTISLYASINRGKPSIVFFRESTAEAKGRIIVYMPTYCVIKSLKL